MTFNVSSNSLGPFQTPQNYNNLTRYRGNYSKSRGKFKITEETLDFKWENIKKTEVRRTQRKSKQRKETNPKYNVSIVVLILLCSETLNAFLRFPRLGSSRVCNFWGKLVTAEAKNVSPLSPSTTSS